MGRAIALLGVVLAVGGCRSPIERRSEQELRRSVVDSVRREVREAEGYRDRRQTSRDAGVDQLEIRPEHLDLIEKEYSPRSYLERLGQGAEAGHDPIESLLSEDLYGRPQRVVGVSLERCVRSAVQRNLDVQLARFGPAVREADVVAAQAAFDWVLFSENYWTDTDRPQAGSGFGGMMGSVTNSSQSLTSSTGVRKNLITGGSVEVRQDLLYTDVRTSFFGVSPTPNPAQSVDLTVGVTQPLLRGAGAGTALAQVRLAQNAERADIATLKSQLLATVTSVESAYWDLLLAYNELAIRQRLLDRGVEVRDDIKVRRIQDARQAQVADAAARVERRKGQILIAQTRLRRASDRLKALINDPDLPVGSEIMLVPVDHAVDEPIEFSLVDAITTAIDSRPEIDQAILSIDDSSIREVVARNARLPRLDLQAEVTMIGFDSSMDRAYGNLGDNEFLDEFLLGVLFEQPIGNRLGEAGYRKARLERLRAITGYRKAVQDVVLDVKDELDAVVRDYKLIVQARLTRIAQGEALRTLGVEKQLTDRGYTVERLNVELNQQESLAEAEVAEVAALVAYNTSLARLYAAMGTALERSRIDFVVPDANQVLEGDRALDYRVDGTGDEQGAGDAGQEIDGAADGAP
ncbi:MAG: TolC family protein [Phycisphaerales bacterium]